MARSTVIDRLFSLVISDVTWSDLRRRHKSRPMSLLTNDGKTLYYLGENHNYNKKWILPERVEGRWEYRYLDDENVLARLKGLGMKDKDFKEESTILTDLSLRRVLELNYNEGLKKPGRASIIKLMHAKIDDQVVGKEIDEAEVLELKSQATSLVQAKYDEHQPLQKLNDIHRQLDTPENWEDIGIDTGLETKPVLNKEAAEKYRKLLAKSRSEGLSSEEDDEFRLIKDTGLTAKQREAEAKKDDKCKTSITRKDNPSY